MCRGRVRLHPCHRTTDKVWEVMRPPYGPNEPLSESLLSLSRNPFRAYRFAKGLLEHSGPTGDDTIHKAIPVIVVAAILHIADTRPDLQTDEVPAVEELGRFFCDTSPHAVLEALSDSPAIAVRGLPQQIADTFPGPSLQALFSDISSLFDCKGSQRH